MLDPDRPPPAAHADPPTDDLVLAALERAALHRARETSAVPVWSIFEHLGIPRRSGAARRVRVRLDVLHAAGWIELSRHHGVQTWELTGTGSRHLKRECRAGRVPPLPESPQHAAWRNAHTTAAHEIDRFRRSLRAHLREAARMLDAEETTGSDAWFELAERLHRECRRIGSATHCLREWAEPDDARADIDERLELEEQVLDRTEQVQLRARRAGRRNVTLWDFR